MVIKSLNLKLVVDLIQISLNVQPQEKVLVDGMLNWKFSLLFVKSGMQRSPTLSVTESELVAGVACAQDMLYDKNLSESIGLQIELPMKLEMANKGAVDLTHSFLLMVELNAPNIDIYS